MCHSASTKFVCLWVEVIFIEALWLAIQGCIYKWQTINRKFDENFHPQKCKSTIISSTIWSLKCHHHGNLMWNVNLQKKKLYSKKRQWNFFLKYDTTKPHYCQLNYHSTQNALNEVPCEDIWENFEWDFFRVVGWKGCHELIFYFPNLVTPMKNDLSFRGQFMEWSI